jgi:hypothetical protein
MKRSIRRKINESIKTYSPEYSITSQVEDRVIYAHFLGMDLKMGELIISPIRAGDKKPTFNLFEAKEPRWPKQVLFKDFQLKAGNVFRFVQLFAREHYDMHMAMGEEVCDFIRTQLALKDGMPKWEAPLIEYDMSREYGVKVMPYRRNHIEYWDEDLGVTQDYLEYYDVKAAQYLLGENDTIIKNFGHTTTFAYLMADKFKLYQPYEENFRKFFNTCPKEYIQGFGQCPNPDGGGDIVVLGKSMKDVLVTQAHTDEFLDIVAPHGEGYNLTDGFIKWLCSFKRLVMMYDPDGAGIKNMNKVKRQVRKSRFYRGSEITWGFMSEKRVKRGDEYVFPVKDPSDFRFIYGKTKTKERLKQIIYG